VGAIKEEMAGNVKAIDERFSRYGKGGGTRRIIIIVEPPSNL